MVRYWAGLCCFPLSCGGHCKTMHAIIKGVLLSLAPAGRSALERPPSEAKELYSKMFFSYVPCSFPDR
jgi:hypothetical protein